MLCSCCSQKEFADCCGPLLEGDTAAPTPEALMRSRYSAYCHKNFDYLVNTTDPQVRLEFDHEGTRKWMDEATFTLLEVLKTSMDGNKGVVEFKAHFQVADKPPEVHHEVARFRKQAGSWYFRPR
jgi:SEC-C motif-containing protein